jgi:predicted metal-dependent peptidase
MVENKPEINISEWFIEGITAKELIYVIIHEMMHYVSGHTIRRGDRNPKIYNIAADHCINDRINNDIRNNKLFESYVKMPRDAVIIDEFREVNTSTEEVYDWLLQNGSFNEDESEFTLQNGQSFRTPSDLLQIEISDITPEDVQKVNNMQSEIRSILASNMLKGSESSSLVEYIKKIVNVEIPWYVILENCIKSVAVHSQDNTTWKNVNKIYKALGYTLPSYDDEQTFNRIILVIDTSGSITQDDLQQFGSVITQSLIFFNRITIIQHDYEIKSVENYEKYEFNIENIKIKGRGGTSHKKVYEYIENEQDPIDMIIFLTDLYSDIEDYHNKFSWTDIIPFKFLCNSDNCERSPKYILNNTIKIKKKETK